MVRKFFLTLFTLILAIYCFSQPANTYFLRWKLKPNEVLSYDTHMEEIDTLNHKDFSVIGMEKVITGDTIAAISEEMKQLNKEMVKADIITSLKENKEHIIDIEMFFKKAVEHTPLTDTIASARALNEFQSMVKNANGGVVLRGSIYEDGTIKSFYTKNDQKNLIAVFFELPGKSIKTGDSWPLDVHLISMDESFVCDTSFRKNNVKVIGIENKNGEHIVTLRYDITEFVQGDFYSPVNNESIKSMMKFTYKALANFSIEKGRWVNYDGIMSMSASGIMTSQTTKHFSLVVN
jgi:hypothetical protein